jgi:hypothetical protein
VKNGIPLARIRKAIRPQGKKVVVLFFPLEGEEAGEGPVFAEDF